MASGVGAMGDVPNPSRNRLLGSVQGSALVNKGGIGHDMVIRMLSNSIGPAVANPLGLGAPLRKVGFKRAVRR